MKTEKQEILYNKEDNDYKKFLIFLLCTDSELSADFLKVLGENVFYFCRKFGGKTFKVPTEEKYREAIYYYKIVNEYSKYENILNPEELSKYIIRLFNLTKLDYENFLNEYAKYKSNYVKLVKEHFSGYIDHAK